MALLISDPKHKHTDIAKLFYTFVCVRVCVHVCGCVQVAFENNTETATKRSEALHWHICRSACKVPVLTCSFSSACYETWLAEPKTDTGCFL